MNMHRTEPREKPIHDRFFVRIPRKAVHALLLSAVCLPTPWVNAVETPQQSSLTLQQAVQRTLEQHPQLSVYLHQRDAFQGAIEQSSVGQRPTIGLMVEEFAGSGDYGSFDSAQSTLSINWVMQGSRVESRTATARVAASQVELQQQIAALDLSAQTARLFVQALVEEQRLRLAAQATAQARKAVTASNKRVEAGKSPDFEQLQAEVELAQRELEAEDLQHGLTSAYYQLSAQWGERGKRYRLAGDLLNMPVIDDIDRQFERLQQNPNLALLATQQRITASEMELARIEAKPQWQFSLGVRRFEATDDVAMVAGVSVPLGSDRSSAGKMRRLQARQAQYASESDAVQRQLEIQLYVLLQEIKHSQHVIETLQERIIPALDKAERQATRAYESGRLGYPQWSDILHQKIGAQQDLLSAYEAIHLQHIELQRLTGTSLTL